MPKERSLRISFLIGMLASYINLWLHIKPMTGYYFSRMDFYFIHELTYRKAVCAYNDRDTTQVTTVAVGLLG